MLDMDSPDYEDRLSTLFGASIRVGHANVGVPAVVSTDWPGHIQARTVTVSPS